MAGRNVRSERLFLALYPDAGIRARLARETEALSRKYPLPGLRWMPGRHLHLTLKFLGDVDPGQREELIARLEQPGLAGRAFEMAAAHYGYFPNRKRARVFYLALGESEPLRILAGAIDRVCREVIPSVSTGAFRPHITLARMGRRFNAHDALPLPARERPAPWQQKVDAFHLVRSDLSAAGAKYTVVHTFFLPETK